MYFFFKLILRIILILIGIYLVYKIGIYDSFLGNVSYAEQNYGNYKFISDWELRYNIELNPKANLNIAIDVIGFIV
jgi:hypothetical protein